jgi:gas vesicle protein
MKVVFYAIAGLAVGIGIGLLFAPDSGREMRRKLKYSTDNLKKRLGLDGEDFSDSELEMDATHGRTFV